MTIPTLTRNEMLDGIPFAQASLHDGYPGATGVSEITGVTRQTVVVDAASGGIRALNASAAFTVPASTVRWIGFWDGTTFIDAVPNGGATPKNFVCATTDYADKIICPGHSYAANQALVFYHGVPPTGITEGAIVYARDVTTDTFKVSTTAGGAALSLSASSSFGCVVCAITETVYPASGTHTLATFQATIPD